MVVGDQKDLYNVAKAELDTVAAESKAARAELVKISKGRKELEKKIETSELESKRITIQVDKYNKNKGQAERQVASMLKKHTWITQEKENFGVANGDYDFGKKVSDE